MIWFKPIQYSRIFNSILHSQCHTTQVRRNLAHVESLVMCWCLLGERGQFLFTSLQISLVQVHFNSINSGLIFSWLVPPLGLGFVIKARPSSPFVTEARNLCSCNLFVIIWIILRLWRSIGVHVTWWMVYAYWGNLVLICLYLILNW